MKQSPGLALVCAAVILLAWASPGEAGPVFNMGFGAGTLCATGCGGTPNLAGKYAPLHFSIYYDTDDPAALSAVDPVLLIVGVPNVTDPNFFKVGSIVSLTSYNPYPDGPPVGSPPNSWNYGTAAYGLNGEGYQGNFTSGEIYSFLNLSTIPVPPGGRGRGGGGGGSVFENTFENWRNAAATHAGVDAAGFGIYAFAVHAALNPHGIIQIEVASELGGTVRTTVPAGSFLLGYSHDTADHAFWTPFTQAALQNSSVFVVPEPASILLLGTGFLVMGHAWRRKSRERATGQRH